MTGSEHFIGPRRYESSRYTWRGSYRQFLEPRLYRKSHRLYALSESGSEYVDPRWEEEQLYDEAYGPRSPHLARRTRHIQQLALREDPRFAAADIRADIARQVRSNIKHNAQMLEFIRQSGRIAQYRRLNLQNVSMEEALKRLGLTDGEVRLPDLGDSECVTQAEAGALLGISHIAIRKWIERGVLQRTPQGVTMASIAKVRPIVEAILDSPDYKRVHVTAVQRLLDGETPVSRREPQNPDELTLADAGHRLGASVTIIRKLLLRGLLTRDGRWITAASVEALQPVVEAVQAKYGRLTVNAIRKERDQQSFQRIFPPVVTPDEAVSAAQETLDRARQEDNTELEQAALAVMAAAEAVTRQESLSQHLITCSAGLKSQPFRASCSCGMFGRTFVTEKQRDRAVTTHMRESNATLQKATST